MTLVLLEGFLARQRLRAGLLSDHISTLAGVLASRGYARVTIEEHIRLVADLGLWLDRRRLALTDLDERLVVRFLDHLRRRGRRARSNGAKLTAALEELRGAGVLSPRTTNTEIGASPINRVALDFMRYLFDQRGLNATTRANYAADVRRLLTRCFHDGPVKLDELCPEDISRFITHEAQRVSLGRAKGIVSALRSFLRWLHQRGDTDTDLAGCVPAVSGWRLATLPKSIAPEQVEILLQHCDRATVVGRRDYAILLLLARLGLRAGEVVGLELDDIDWEAGEIVVRGKGGRFDRLPLPPDVGVALAAYLREGRPSCSTRRVFVRVIAPCRGFAGSAAICVIVRHALNRAGIESSRTGAHVLRHTLATTMLNRGASLAEIGEVLRHRSLDATAIYAKVDLAALRTLAPSWPQAGGDA